VLELGSFFDPDLFAPSAAAPTIPTQGNRRAPRWEGPRYYGREQCGARVDGYEPKAWFAGCEARGDVGPPLNATHILAEVRRPGAGRSR
jgi:hypothetical protein